MMKTLYPWQQKQWLQVSKYYINGTMPHGLLITGAAGVGKTVFAQAVAELLLCEKNDNFACGQCRSCHWLQAQTHPDLFLISPEEDSKSIKVEQVRQLTTQLNQTAQNVGGYQIAIVYPADAMNHAAANALLKTLEEPAGKVVIILVTDHEKSLPATVRSRCQKIKFSTPPLEEVRPWLIEKMGTEQNIDLLLSLADYAPLTALGFADGEQLKQRQVFFQQLQQLSEKHLDPVKFAVSCLQYGLVCVIKYLISIITDLVRLKMQVQENFIINKDQLLFLQQLTAKVVLEKLTPYQQKLLDASSLIRQHQSINAQLLLENLLIDWVNYVS